jgi:U2-associated protein SR140
VADIIVGSLLVEGTPVPRKIARLYLICDILHNSAITLPGAWRFRGEFASRLGLAFDHLAGIYHSFPGRITAETFKRQITVVLAIWEDWIVFPPDFTAALRERLEGQVMPMPEEAEEEVAPVVEAAPAEPQVSRFKAIGGGFQPVTALAAEDGADLDGEPMADDLDGEPVGAPTQMLGEDVDGVPLDDVDGEPLDGEPVDVDGEPLDGEPLDGEPITTAAEDDLDGEPMDEDDLDGAPMAV